jgi:hypothetical protein
VSSAGREFNPASSNAVTVNCRRLPLGQRGRWQPGHVLGECQQLLPGVGDSRPRLRPDDQPSRAQAADQLGHAQPDAERPGQYQ